VMDGEAWAIACASFCFAVRIRECKGAPSAHR
jgi:hypothetical protein